MKSNAGKFEPYGEVYEGMPGAVITCLLDRREPRRSTISFCLNGMHLGVAFRLPAWLAEVPLFPAICGREDWRAACRFRDLHFSHGGFRDLDEASSAHLAASHGSDVTAVFAAAPLVDLRELREFDVPDENLVELQNVKGKPIAGDELRRSLLHEHAIINDDIQTKYSADGCMVVVAFTSHRVARSVVAAPPLDLKAFLRPDFSAAAQSLLASQRPTKAATTDAVARRLIAAALDRDSLLSRKQLRQIRAQPVQGGGSFGREPSPSAASGSGLRRPPPDWRRLPEESVRLRRLQLNALQ
ncbi:unnamed protein product [Polarella glacialis]|uniref:SPRY domain-containing protein n=1 Tax=Polarella glacialis TaxID=89957 RepID=A0A813FJH4_POLGL|nr:unnamed protein product [Polarella glacialis]